MMWKLKGEWKMGHCDVQIQSRMDKGGHYDVEIKGWMQKGAI